MKIVQSLGYMITTYAHSIQHTRFLINGCFVFKVLHLTEYAYEAAQNVGLLCVLCILCNCTRKCSYMTLLMAHICIVYVYIIYNLSYMSIYIGWILSYWQPLFIGLDYWIVTEVFSLEHATVETPKSCAQILDFLLISQWISPRFHEISVQPLYTPNDF